ncbi:MAG: hypothetical protein EAS48_02630 [Chryseobacterium sp.]|nr:MAG: hypothetical protein EAS48_02630 [Chryseobacterium sp.]
MRDTRVLQGILSIAALICILIGWLQPFSPEMNYLIGSQLFYVLLGFSFILQAPFLKSRKFTYGMYAAAAACIIGAFIPPASPAVAVKTLGLLVGVILSFVGRRPMPR